MIEAFSLVAGIFLIFYIFKDVLLTTYSMEGGGPMTDYFLKNSWKLFLWIGGYNGRHKLLNLAGMFMMISLIVLWSAGLWLGAFLLFASNPDSVLHSDTLLPTGLWEKLYFSGYILTTMGLGDYVPYNTSWGIISVFFSFFGLLFITLMVSYALPVLSNIITKKQLSLFIQNLGATPVELLVYFWNGKDFSSLKDVSKELQKRILIIGQSHKAYPILHYFHANRKEESLVITLCLIDEALSILLDNVSSDQWDEKEVLPLRKALDNYLETMKVTYKYKEEDTKNRAPEADLRPLVRAKVNCVEKGTPDWRRKNLWTQLLKSKGWAWAEVYPHHRTEKK